MPLRRHPVQRVQQEILLAATGAQLIRARAQAERDLLDDRLPADARSQITAWLEVLSLEIERRGGDGDPSAISVL